MNIDVPAKDLTESEDADGENSSEEPLSGSSSGSGSSSSGLYDDSRQCQNHSADDAVRARAKGPCLRGRTETAFTPYKKKGERRDARLTR